MSDCYCSHVRARDQLEQARLSHHPQSAKLVKLIVKSRNSSFIQYGHIGKRDKEIQWTPLPTSPSLGY